MNKNCRKRKSSDDEPKKRIKLNNSDHIDVMHKEKNKKYACVHEVNGSVCTKSFNAKADFDRHVRTHTGEKPFKCSYVTNEKQCTRTFNQVAHLNRHTKTHIGEKNFKCLFKTKNGICNKSFIDQSGLTSHSNRHTAVKKYHCDFVSKKVKCEYKSSDIGDFKKHKAKHITDKPFCCTFVKKNGKVCNLPYSTKYRLYKHMKTHTQQKTLVCTFVCGENICGEKFTTQCLLKEHTLKHTGEKPFACKFITAFGVCPLTFYNSGELKKHFRVHTGEKPYVCEHLKGQKLCGTEFRLKEQLKRHLYTHTGTKPILCKDEQCDLTFVTNTKMKDHFQRMHSDDAALRRQTKEYRVHQILKENGISFEYNRKIDYKCVSGQDTDNGGLFDKKFARIDFVIYKENHVILLECDEHQHHEERNPWGYTVICDMARMGHVYTSLTVAATSLETSLPVVWIRYNPDMFFVDGLRQSKKITRSIREKRLIKVIDDFVPRQNLSILYMFYDCDTVNGKLLPVIVGNEDFNEDFAKCVLEPIVE